MFCRKCGEEVKEIDNFYGKCGEKQQQKTVTEKKEVKTLSLDSYKHFTREERAGHFKPSKSSTSTSTITRKSEPLMHNVTIYVEIMKNVKLNLKAVRGKELPLKVKTTINYDDLKKRAIEKHSHHDQSFCGLEEYVLLYPDGKEALFLPGITSFQLDSYKEELGKSYSQIVLYLYSTSEFDNASCGAIEFPDPKLSLRGIVTSHFDKIYESEMPVVVDDQEREPNIPVIDLEKEVFDLDSYNYNQTLVTSNVDISFSSVTTNSSSHEDLTTKLKTIRRNFIGNVYDLDQIDVDGIYELKIKRIEIWEHTNIKLKRQLKSSLKTIRIVFTGEPAFDEGGPIREFFTLYFDAAARNIM